jgi:exodeoxyribonuclease V alpha subunit
MISFTIIRELYSEYQDADEVKNRIAEDPYGTLRGSMGFKTADKILIDFEKECNQMDDPPIKFKDSLTSSSMRMEASINHVLESNEMNGNTKIVVNELKKQCKHLTPECMIKFDNVLANGESIVYQGGFVSRKIAYDAEIYIAKKLLDMVQSDNIWDLDLSNFNNEYGMTEQQLNVIKNVGMFNVSICNGGAGTGKSYSTKTLVEILQKNKKTITICAPTGKASKVVKGYTGHEASTIHRLLYSLKDDSGFTHTINSDIVIIDEMSMPDIFLFKWLLESVDLKKTKLLMIGDSAQISSIGAGNILHDILNSSIIPTTILDKVFRYGEGGIMTVATNTKFGKPSFENKSGVQILGKNKDYMFIQSSNPKHSFKTTIELYSKLLKTYSPEDIVVMSPYNVGELGSIAFNNALQPLANPDSTKSDLFIESNKNKFYVGDMVMQTKNNYKSQPYIPNIGWDENDSIIESYMTEGMTKPIFNGDIGKVIKIVGDFALIDFDGIKVVYASPELLTCQRAYSINTYKLQGSNARIVILVTGKEHERNMTSNLLYVAQTRAREKVYHIGDVSTINKAVGKKDELDRLTYLKDFLQGGFN